MCAMRRSAQPITGVDARYMNAALTEAKRAMQCGEVPVGAVLVRNNRMMVAGHNRPIAGNDPTAHAEIVVLRRGGKALSNYRLPECTLYVTLEPCAMCFSALLHARIARLVFGAYDEIRGAVSAFSLDTHRAQNHTMAITGGICEEACRALLLRFFLQKRGATRRHIPLCSS